MSTATAAPADDLWRIAGELDRLASRIDAAEPHHRPASASACTLVRRAVVLLDQAQDAADADGEAAALDVDDVARRLGTLQTRTARAEALLGLDMSRLLDALGDALDIAADISHELAEHRDRAGDEAA